MRKKRGGLLMPSGGAGGGLGSARGPGPAVSFGAGLALAENPVYSPDDSLAKAASKLQSLKALRTSAAPPRPAALSSLAPGAAAAVPVRAESVQPAPQPCESPEVRDVEPRTGTQGAEAAQLLRCADWATAVLRCQAGCECIHFNARALA